MDTPNAADGAHAGAGEAVVPTGGPAPDVTSPGGLAALTAGLGRSARQAGLAALASGRWLAESVVDTAGHLPIRELATLEAHFPGLSGPELADALIRSAAMATAAVGAATGAVMSVEEWLPPSWIVMPVELLVETAAIAAIETKLIGELHEVYGRPVPGSGLERGYALAQAWAERRGVGRAVLTEGAPALGDALGRTARKELIRLVRRRTVRRTGVNLASLGPLMVGGVAGAAVNRRSTMRLGQAVVDSLAGG